MAKQRASLNDRPPVTQAIARKTDDTLLGQERGRQAVEEIPLRQIMPNRLQPRTQPNAAGLEELAQSIRLHGVLEPVLVRPIALTEYEGAGRRYELVAGERRWRASQLAERPSIPALVLGNTTDDQQMLEWAITENLQREDLHPLDEAMAFGRMQQDLGASMAQIAERLGKSKGYVQNRLRLLQLSDDLQQLVAERPDTLKHVYELAKLKDPAARAALISAVRDDKLSVTATRAQVAALSDTPPKSYSREYDSDVHHEQQQEIATATAYSREYDSDNIHKEQGQQLTRSAALRLTAPERTMLVSLTAKVAQLQKHFDQLHPDDWALLAPLAAHLQALLHAIEQQQ